MSVIGAVFVICGALVFIGAVLATWGALFLGTLNPQVAFQCPGCGGRVPGYAHDGYLTCPACETRLHTARTPQHPDK
jgi:hypothetical protein